MRKIEEKNFLLTTGQLAKRLNVTRQTVYNWVRAGKLPYYSFGDGKIFRFDFNEVMKILEKHHKKPIEK